MNDKELREKVTNVMNGYCESEKGTDGAYHWLKEMMKILTAECDEVGENVEYNYDTVIIPKAIHAAVMEERERCVEAVNNAEPIKRGKWIMDADWISRTETISLLGLNVEESK